MKCGNRPYPIERSVKPPIGRSDDRRFFHLISPIIASARSPMDREHSWQTPSASPNKPMSFTADHLHAAYIAAMYWARIVLVPVVLAALLAFVLTPVVSALQRRKVPRVPAALLTAFVAFAFLGGVSRWSIFSS